MKEYVGDCTICQSNVFCDNGFLEGVHENGQLVCLQCSSHKEN